MFYCILDVKFGKVIARSLRSSSLINGEPASVPIDNLIRKSDSPLTWNIQTIVDVGILQLSCTEACDSSVYIGGDSIKNWLDKVRRAFDDAHNALNTLEVPYCTL